MRAAICGIYRFIYVPDGRSYVGSSIDIWQRHRTHLNLASKGSGYSFHRELARFGADNFRFEILEECSPKDRLTREQFYIALHDSVERGFNVLLDPTKNLGVNFTEAVRRKLSMAKLGTKQSPEHIAKVRLAIKRRPPCSMETRAKLSAAGKLRPGKKHTLESRAKMSANHKAHPNSPETRAKISAALKRRNGLHNISLDMPLAFA